MTVRGALIALTLLLSGCPYIGSSTVDDRMDVDGDGVPRPHDCDDRDATVDVLTFYRDADGDGFGDQDGALDTACSRPDGYVDNRSDCNDADSDVHPSADEQCDGIDNNCDGIVDGDDPSVDLPSWWPDVDGDGYGDDDASPVQACVAPEGHAPQAGDCDDVSAQRNPGADELCNDIDDDCNGMVDDEPRDGGHYHPDTDADGFGDENVDTLACERPEGHVDNSLDCDDTNASINPLAYEVCDSLDNNCNSLIDAADPFIIDAVRYYQDSDGDGSGNPVSSVRSCDPVTGYVPDRFDCDDNDATIGPNAPEQCNGIDDDCDALVDDDDDDVDPQAAPPWFADADGDGYGDPDTLGPVQCSLPPGHSANDRDCDDTDALTNEDAQELCDGIDNDCDGDIDNGIPPTWYHDGDGDGFGDPTDSEDVCDAPTPEHVLEAGDCDDTRVDVNPDELELCDGIDNDCNALADDNDPDLQADRAYADGDGDGFGTGSGIITCSPPSGHAAFTGDCDDTDVTVNPGADEICDSKDNDCDGLFDTYDTDLLGANTYYVDADGDGFGHPSQITLACFLPPAHSEIASDCDDTVAAVNPTAAEICDGIDNNCDGDIDLDDDDVDTSSAHPFYADTDGDGFGDPFAPSAAACEAPTGFVDDASDCDDSSDLTFPGATEQCDGVDNDCDFAVPTDEVDIDVDGLRVCDGDCDDGDASIGGATSWYADADLDGYGDSDVGLTACICPAGYTADATDCDDSEPTISPGASETCNGIDDNCDSVLPADEVDADGDGYSTCELDCDDGEAAANPAGVELCDGIDNDCDGNTDEGWTPDGLFFYQDSDSDGYGNPAIRIRRCSIPSGYAANNLDCDDDPALCGAGCTPVGTEGPTGTASCTDGWDNDCDGDIDLEQAQCQSMPWQDLSCNHRVEIKTAVTGLQTQTDVPVLVKLDPSRIVYGDTAIDDFRFYTEGGTPMAHEVESWNPSFESFIWVKLPAVSGSTNDVFHLYYDCSNTSSEDPGSVWDDYAAVWHLGPSLTDSSPAGNDLTDDGTANVAGAIARARYADGQGSTHLDGGSDASLNIHGDLTITAWVNLTTLRSGTWENTIIGRGGNADSPSVNYAYHLYFLDDGRLEAFWERASGQDTYLTSTASTGVTPGSWHQVGIRRDSAQRDLAFLHNGGQLGTPVSYTADPTHGASAFLALAQDPCCIGGGSYALDGTLDEVRISASARSDDWLQTQYLSMTDALLLYAAPE